jgi:response regulator RpfG family c-di-GMP phosphodiesterase
MKSPIRIIVIDDDLINNMICRQTIKSTNPDLETLTFNIPEKGFEYVEKEYTAIDKEQFTILFLDINMPTWSGWEFLDNFDNLDVKIKEQIKIYMLSSSVDLKDMERAQNNKNVVDYLVKPLKKTTFLEILEKSSNFL